MEKIHFSVTINAPREKVWDTMLGDTTYRQWTQEFNPNGSWYEGDWSEGSPMRFIGPDKDGNLGGMVSRIKENRLHEFVSIEHLGFINNGVDDTTSEAVLKWAGACENYTFADNTDGTTEVTVDMDTTQEFKEMFEGMWPKALVKLKEIAEK